MKKNIITLLVVAGAATTSCTTVTNTASTADVQPEVIQRTTVADLDVDPKRVEGYQEWKWTFFHRLTQPSFALRKQNLVADMLRERDADVLVEPQVTYTQKLFGKRTLRIVGYPARLKNFHTASHEELRDLGLVAAECTGNHTACTPSEKTKRGTADAPARNGKATKRTAPMRYNRYLRGGLSIINLRGGDGLSPKARASYDLTFGWKKHMKQSPFYYALELGLGSRGYKSSNGGYDTKAMAHEVHFSPVTFGFKKGLGENFALDIHAGFYGSYDYTSRYKQETSYSTIESDWEGCDDGFDLGMTVGVGVWYKRYNFDIAFRPGFIEKKAGTYSNCTMLRFGIAF